MNELQQAHIIALIATINGVSFANIDTETVMKLNKGRGANRNPHFENIIKRTEGIQVMLCRSGGQEGESLGSPAYQNMVNRRLEAEGKTCDFESAGLAKWAEIVDFPVFKHTDKDTHYVQCIYLNYGTSTTYLLNGKPIDKADIQGIPKAKAEATQGGLSDDTKVYVRTPKIENIVGMRLLGENLETA